VADAGVKRWLDELTLEEKCTLLGGASSWRTHALERLGIPAVKMTDGPNGARGEGQGTSRTAGAVLPVGIVMGASWDPDLAAAAGDLLGRETVRRGAHVVLAPTVNLHRTPIGGRTFEAFSEDPELTAALAVRYVQAVQAHGIAVTVKHFVGNDTEVDRHVVDVRIGDRALRELYLRPFEAAVVDGGAWGIMSAYNRFAGEFCAANDALLNGILRDEWGFDGFVVSDWFGAHDPALSAGGGLTIEMPGPARVYGARLQKVVEDGRVAPEVVDRLVAELLTLIERTNAVELSADRAEESVEDEAERALCRRIAVGGTVLLRNDGTLPLDAGQLRTIAVIGPNAADSRIMGGGSSALQPLPHVSILQAITDHVAEAGITVTHEPGVRTDKRTPLPRRSQLLGPDGEPGLEISFVNGSDPDGPVVARQRSNTTILQYLGSAPEGVDPNRFRLRISGAFVPEVDGPHEVGAVVTGAAEVVVGTTTVLSDPTRQLPRGDAFYGIGSIEVLETIQLTAGQPVTIDVDLQVDLGFGGFRLGFRTPEPADLMDRAVAAAAAADAAILVVGTNEEWETEGNDRDTITLPGAQDELIRCVAAANARTIVVVNAGSPVAMPWADDVPAILVPFFGGLELGPAVADVLFGLSDPGGRLPTTFPRALEDTPAWPHYAPVDGVQTYGEGMLMGYRGFEAAGTEPLFPFGHGLSYGEVAWGDAIADADTISVTDLEAGGRVVVQMPLSSIGSRAATAVVQGYVATDEPKQLKAFAKHALDAGGHAVAELRFGHVAFRRWSVDDHAWVIEPGTYELVIARSAASTDEHARLRLTVTA
jgi:beta-glucosidase